MAIATYSGFKSRALSDRPNSRARKGVLSLRYVLLAIGVGGVAVRFLEWFSFLGRLGVSQKRGYLPQPELLLRLSTFPKSDNLSSCLKTMLLNCQQKDYSRFVFQGVFVNIFGSFQSSLRML